MAEPRRPRHPDEEPAASSVKGARFLIVEARFYDDIGALLLEGAKRAFAAAEAQCETLRVSGALEIPIAMEIALDAAEQAGHPYHGAVALGCVIRGETYHFEIVAGESARALMDLAVRRRLAFGNGILTVENEAQARIRASHDGGDKGGDAARAALALYRLKAACGSALMAKALERAAARLAAVQALYQMDVSGKGINETLAEFETFWIGGEIEGETYNAAEMDFFRDILTGVLADQGPIDRQIDKTLVQTWPLARVDSVLRAILRAGTYELKKRKDVPAKVVIKEYADVAGAFFEREEVGMINAVLDALARQLRAGEFEAKSCRPKVG